jgi:CRISPR-associated protein (TIGR03986 family)
MAHRILGAQGELVRVSPPVPDRDRNPSNTLKKESIAVTDQTVGLLPGTEIEKGDPNYFVVKYAPSIPLLGGQAPSLAQNPYNFVEMPAGDPWLDQPEAGCCHAGHDRWKPQLCSGRIRFALAARTPVFVPKAHEGPAAASEDPDGQPVEFFQLHRPGHAEPQFAIHGASLKGVLRSNVEALANDRLGCFNPSFEQPIPYRRRVYADGATTPRVQASAGVLVYRDDKVWHVEEVAIDYLNANDPAWRGKLPTNPTAGNFAYTSADVSHRKVAMPGAGYIATDVRPFRGNLLWTTNTTHKYTHVILRRTRQMYQLPKRVAEYYDRNLQHSHYANHYKEADKKLRDTRAFRYTGPMPPLDRIEKDLKRMDTGELIYFTWFQATPSIRGITSFGKNINYIWPAAHSVKELAKPYVREETDPLHLKDPLGLADRMFGFSAKHKKDQSHPFRGKVQIETLWGPSVSIPTISTPLAPLTSPATRGKARPLYLEGQNDDSASYSDKKAPRLMGRKFYWHQRSDASRDNTQNELWKIHQRGTGHVTGQLRAPVLALPVGSEFTGCIHFENLSDEELGALLFALAGPPETAGSPGYYDHCIKVGKGKPRGMGSMKARIDALEFRNPTYYDSLDAEAAPYVPAGKLGDYIGKFREWCAKHAGKPFHDIPHVRDYIHLHTWPGTPSLRLYPINFKDYGWLPKDNTDPDEARGGRRPKSLPRARDLDPVCNR